MRDDRCSDATGLKIIFGSLIFIFLFAFTIEKLSSEEATPPPVERLLQNCAKNGAVVSSLGEYKYHCVTKYCYSPSMALCIEEQRDKIWRCLGRSVDRLMDKGLL